MSENPQKYKDNAVGDVGGKFAKLLGKAGGYLTEKAKSREDNFDEAKGGARNDESKSSWLNPEHVDAIKSLLEASTGHDIAFMQAEKKQERKGVKSAVKSANKVKAQGNTKQGFKVGAGGTVDMVHTRAVEPIASAESPAVPSAAPKKTAAKPAVKKASAPAKTAPKRAPTPKAGK